jgi:hypothetical protein
MNIDPIIKNKLKNEVSTKKFEEHLELTRLALTDILDEDEIERLFRVYNKFNIRICDNIEKCKDIIHKDEFSRITGLSIISYKLELLCKNGITIDNLMIPTILRNYNMSLNYVHSTDNTIITNICKNNKIIGYNMYPYLYIFHIDDVRAVKSKFCQF